MPLSLMTYPAPLPCPQLKFLPFYSSHNNVLIPNPLTKPPSNLTLPVSPSSSFCCLPLSLTSHQYCAHPSQHFLLFCHTHWCLFQLSYLHSPLSSHIHRGLTTHSSHAYLLLAQLSTIKTLSTYLYCPVTCSHPHPFFSHS